MRKKSLHNAQRREFAEKWRQWTQVVELFAKHKDARVRVSPEKYAELHKQLTELCSKQSEEVDPELLKDCREMLAPWVTLESLVWTERGILLDLWKRCLQVGYRLDGKRTKGLPLSTVCFLGAATVAGLVSGVLWSGIQAPKASPVQEAQRWLHELERTISRLPPEELTVLGLGLAMIVGAILWRVARGY